MQQWPWGDPCGGNADGLGGGTGWQWGTGWHRGMEYISVAVNLELS